MSAQASATVEKVLQGLTTLGPFSYQTYRQGVKDLLAVDTDHWSSPCASPVFGEDPGGNKTTVNRFKVETVALGISRTSGYGFSDCVLQVPNPNDKTCDVMLTFIRMALQTILTGQLLRWLCRSIAVISKTTLPL